METPKVIILSGVSGSGKSTYVNSVLGVATEQIGGKGSRVKVSADDFFVDKLGAYCFDPRELSAAHGQCFRNFITHLCHGESLIVVDNTNTTACEIAPYVLGAEAWKYDVEIITLMCENDLDVERCAARNKHSVSLFAVQAMHKRLQERQLMPWWKNTVIPVNR
jgi:predicted ABC-type ATPase